MPLYLFKNKENGEIREIFSSFNDRDKIEGWEYVPWFSIENTQCYKQSKGLTDVNAEVWEKEAEYCKRMKPKFVVTKSGQKIKYDSTKMS